MATVNLTNGVIDEIGFEVERIVWKNQGALPAFPQVPRDGTLDAAYDLVLPSSAEAEIRKSMKGWTGGDVHNAYITVYSPGQKRRKRTPYNFDYELDRRQSSLGSFKTPRLKLYGKCILSKLPGIETIEFDGTTIHITPSEDGVQIENPQLRAYVEAVNKWAKTIEDAKTETCKAVSDMKTFLQQHTTLEKALAEFAPLEQYLPRHIKLMHEREEQAEKKARKKRDKTPVDMSSLMVHAATHKLQLN